VEFLGEERNRQHLFWKGKGAREVILGSRTEGLPEDAAARQRVTVGYSQSRTTFGLIWGGKQQVEPVGSKCCLGQILLLRSNRMSK
jgi:hypothetical protein